MLDRERGDDSLLSELLSILESAELQDLLLWIDEHGEPVRRELLSSISEESAPENVVLELSIGHDQLLGIRGSIDIKVILEDLSIECERLVLLDAELDKLVSLHCFLLDLSELFKDILLIALLGLVFS